MSEDRPEGSSDREPRPVARQQAKAGNDAYLAQGDMHNELNVYIYGSEVVDTRYSNELASVREAASASAKSIKDHIRVILMLQRLLQKLSSQVRTLITERDALKADLRARSDLDAQLRASLADANRRLEAALHSQRETELCLARAERQRSTAERLYAEALEKLEQIRLAAQGNSVPPSPGAATDGVAGAAEPTFGQADQEAVDSLLSNTERFLGEQATKLDQVRDTIREAGDGAQTPQPMAPDPADSQPSTTHAYDSYSVADPQPLNFQKPSIGEYSQTGPPHHGSAAICGLAAGLSSYIACTALGFSISSGFFHDGRLGSGNYTALTVSVIPLVIWSIFFIAVSYDASKNSHFGAPAKHSHFGVFVFLCQNALGYFIGQYHSHIPVLGHLSFIFSQWLVWRF